LELVGWYTSDAPTYRHRAFAAYQSGRRFDAELLDQLDVPPQFVAACGFVCAKSPGYEADDFLIIACTPTARPTEAASKRNEEPHRDRQTLKACPLSGRSRTRSGVTARWRSPYHP
jgi:hypothetical protein